MLICKKDGCEAPAAMNQVYCTREHSPYGMIFSSSEKGGRRKYDQTTQDRIRAQITACAARGMSIKDTADKLKRSYTTIRNYSERFGIKFKRARGTRNHGRCLSSV